MEDSLEMFICKMLMMWMLLIHQYCTFQFNKVMLAQNMNFIEMF